MTISNDSRLATPGNMHRHMPRTKEEALQLYRAFNTQADTPLVEDGDVYWYKVTIRGAEDGMLPEDMQRPYLLEPVEAKKSGVSFGSDVPLIAVLGDRALRAEKAEPEPDDIDGPCDTESEKPYGVARLAFNSGMGLVDHENVTPVRKIEVILGGGGAPALVSLDGRFVSNVVGAAHVTDSEGRPVIALAFSPESVTVRTVAADLHASNPVPNWDDAKDSEYRAPSLLLEVPVY